MKSETLNKQTKKFDDLAVDRGQEFMDKLMKEHPEMHIMMVIALLTAWRQGWQDAMIEAQLQGVEKIG